MSVRLVTPNSDHCGNPSQNTKNEDHQPIRRDLTGNSYDDDPDEKTNNYTRRDSDRETSQEPSKLRTIIGKVIIAKIPVSVLISRLQRRCPSA